MQQRLNSPARWSAAVLLLVTGAVHVPLIPDHLEEAPYAAVLFVALSLSCAVLAVVLVLGDTPVVWTLSGVVTLLALVTFLASRTIGLPQLGDDVGNWTEPLGFPALAAELLTTVIAGSALMHRSAHHGKGTS